MNIIAISLPLPFALKQVTAYVIQNGNKLSIIDTGLHTEQTKEVWVQVFQEKSWSFEQIEQIIVTHYHPDHYGFAGVLQQYSGASVYIAEKEFQYIQAFWDRKNGKPAQVASFFHLYGFPLHLMQDVTNHMNSFRPYIEPHPNVLFIQSGKMIDIGGQTFDILHTPGHSDGHLSFFNRDNGVLLAGDILLPTITPNIPLLPGADPNPLSTFFATLEQLNRLSIDVVYPAHGEPFTHYQERIKVLRLHHDRRLEKILQFIRTTGRVTGYDVCQFLFADRNLDVHNLRFAFSETLAHLEYLRYEGTLRQDESNGILYYYI